uniref:Ig-like domain-containing protein n=1 Tax=Neogobius melanostomus TaxID=47308 RepID=A0A8C6SP79_9GOBI
KQQYGRAGETVVLSPGPISETLSMAYWKFNQRKLVDINRVFNGHQFSGRVSLNQTNYSLTIQDLRTTDSGDFNFVSALTQPPTLNVINTTEISKESCEVWMKCSYTSDQDVSYRWTVNDVMINGSTLQYPLKPHEGDTTFTCTASNMVSEVSASKNINCRSPPVGMTFTYTVLIPVGKLILSVSCQCGRALWDLSPDVEPD